MGIKLLTFVDNNPPQCDAEYLNSVKGEINNFITSTGAVAGVADLTQTSNAVAEYVAGADFYTDSGIADVYVLSAVGSKEAPTQYFDGLRIRFRAGAVNTGASTVDLNSLGVKNIKLSDGASDPAAGDIPLGTEVQMTYDGTNFRLEVGQPPSVVFPTGSLIAFAGVAAPAGWLLSYGQAVSRVTYSTLFATIATAYGIGDGATTFNLPDTRGRAVIGLDDLGGVSANRLTDVNADSLNNTGGGSETPVITVGGTADSHVLITSEMPAHTHPVLTSATGEENGVERGLTSTSGASATGSTGGGGGHTHNLTGATATGAAGTNAQPWLPASMIIKT